MKLYCCVTKNTTMRITLSLLFIFNVIISFGQKPCLGYSKETIESKHLNESREIWIKLPDKYIPELSYPVIYLLDAESHFDIGTAVVKNLAANDRIPEHIMVGIPFVDHEHRFKDFTYGISEIDGMGNIDTTKMWNKENTGGGKEMQAYLEKEVVPFIDEKYKTTGLNVIVGHSLTGLFVAHLLGESEAFRINIIQDASIWYNRGDVIGKLDTLLKPTSVGNAFLSSALVDGTDVTYHLDKIDSLGNYLKQYANVRVHHIKYETEDHLSVYMYGLIDGLKWAYDGYNFGYIAPTDPVTSKDYIEKYKAFSKKIGFQFDPPVSVVRWVAYATFNQEKWEDTVESLERCYFAFKDDPFVNLELAISYDKLNQKEKSQEYVKKCRELAPNHPYIKIQLEQFGL